MTTKLMITAMLQDKKLLCTSHSLSYVPAMNQWDLNLKHNTFMLKSQKNKMLRYNLTSM